MRYAPVSLVALMLIGAPAAAQQTQFDSKKFFEELSSRGVSMPANFDAKRFFDELSSRGVSASKPLDAKAFFEELSSRGVAVPSHFDSKKFFDEIEAKGVAMPCRSVANSGHHRAWRYRSGAAHDSVNDTIPAC